MKEGDQPSRQRDGPSGRTHRGKFRRGGRRDRNSDAQQGPRKRINRFKSNQNDADEERSDRPRFRRRFIAKDRNPHANDAENKGTGGGEKKFVKRDFKKKGDDRDLDRELRNYWITKNGGKVGEDGKDLAKEKMNSELDDYWKNRKQANENKVQ